MTEKVFTGTYLIKANKQVQNRNIRPTKAHYVQYTPTSVHSYTVKSRKFEGLGTRGFMSNYQ